MTSPDEETGKGVDFPGSSFSLVNFLFIIG